MRKNAIVTKHHAAEVREVEPKRTEIIEPLERSSPFFSFRYSYTQVSMVGGKAHVKARETRFADGKLERESFDGELERSAYEQAVSRAQQQMADQTRLLWRTLSWFLPKPRD